MDSRIIILAVAGAGKTYEICHRIDETKKNLILAYTNENIKNIKSEILKKYGEIPPLTKIMTFDTFKYRYMLCPYEPTILKHFNVVGFRKKGITISEPPTKMLEDYTTKNPYYVKADNFSHYINSQNKYYCANLSELIMNTKDNNGRKLIFRIAKNINNFFDCIYIDEFQDFRKKDYDLIIELCKKVNNVVLVGDYYQHSVSGKNNSGKPFKKVKKDVSYDEFINELQKLKFIVDDTTFSSSRRCPVDICDFVRNKLGINIQAHSENKNIGQVILVDHDKVEIILNDDSIIKLLIRDSDKYNFKSLNWGYSKGDTFEKVCVILNDDSENIIGCDFNVNLLPNSTRNKLYVALTRTKGDLFLIKNSDFKELKNSYLKQAEGIT